MPEFEKEEFKFPDEQETENKISIEIEVEEDTPEEDRNVNPLPEDLREDLYKDEMEDYSAKVKKKLMQMKKLAHDERREKEQARREQEEAISLAQRILEENKRLKALASETEKSAISSVAKTVEMEMAEADREFRAAYESGDTDSILKAQKKLWEATLKKEKLDNYKPALQEESIPVQRQSQDVQTPRADPKAVEWQRKNPWFGEDKLMTGLALAVHEQLKEEGVALSSQEYYRRIDESMRKRFPERFETDTPKDSRPSRQSTVVAPASRSTSPKKISLKASQVALAKKLGLTPEQYAQELIKMES
ncbi:hypothetical protein UFOVP274_8 [uncultured Caudovirales phage]|uniref:Uncharacterized protein n=1 Tax=uncultured Caudovirales phage TaxID=2100421 RepID=A0A6J5LSF9_9CAUD|nr:hypothetical protein UFOVP274_8 [uncultured Caudovirales phage]